MDEDDGYEIVTKKKGKRGGRKWFLKFIQSIGIVIKTLYNQKLNIDVNKIEEFTFIRYKYNI